MAGSESSDDFGYMIKKLDNAGYNSIEIEKFYNIGCLVKKHINNCYDCVIISNNEVIHKFNNYPINPIQIDEKRKKKEKLKYITQKEEYGGNYWFFDNNLYELTEQGMKIFAFKDGKFDFVREIKDIKIPYMIENNINKNYTNEIVRIGNNLIFYNSINNSGLSSPPLSKGYITKYDLVNDKTTTIDGDFLFGEYIQDYNMKKLFIFKQSIILVVNGPELILYDINNDYIVGKLDIFKPGSNIANVFKFYDDFIIYGIFNGTTYIHELYSICLNTNFVIGSDKCKKCENPTQSNRVVVPCGHTRFCKVCFDEIAKFGICQICKEKIISVIEIKK